MMKMHDHFHHVPGRLRVTSSKLKRNPAAAARLQTALQELSGVRSVTVSPITGSILIHYDRKATGVEQLLTALRSRGYGPECSPEYSGEKDRSEQVWRPANRRAARRTSDPEWSKVLGSFLVQKAVEVAIERSVLALVAAVL
jgi:copper chaperone CopZ